jgi:DNA excision repair protein ERCC-4
LASDYA